MKILVSPFPLIFLFFIRFHPISGQSPAAAPEPPGQENLTSILEKASQFTTFIRLLQRTKVGDQIFTQLDNSNQGLTIFAPTTTPPTSIQFQTASNPLHAQAGGSKGQFTLNVTATGNQVNITTGVTNATIGNTVYSDNQLAVYQVDQVLLPLNFFMPPPVSAPSKPKEGAASPDASSGSHGGNPPDSDSSGEIYLSGYPFLTIFSMMVVLAAFS